MINRKTIIKIFLFVCISLSLKLSVYAAELQEYGFNNFEDIDSYLGELYPDVDDCHLDAALDEVILYFGEDAFDQSSVEPEIPNGDKFKTFLDKVLDDTFNVLTHDLSHHELWQDRQIPGVFSYCSNKYFMLKDKTVVVESDLRESFYNKDYCYFAEKDKIDEPCNVVVIGDMHGNYKDFSRIIRNLIDIDNPILTKDLKLIPGNKIVFLGDFVDRGPKSLELALFIFLLKILNPETITILKGNHEDFYMTSRDGFKKELLNKLHVDSALSFYGRFICLFQFLPEAYCLQVLNKNFLFSHGGWSDNFNYSDFVNDQDSKFKKTFFGNNKQGMIPASPFLWNDISPWILVEEIVPNRGICYPVEGICDYMGIEDLDRGICYPDALFSGHGHYTPKRVEHERKTVDEGLNLNFNTFLVQPSSGFCPMDVEENKVFLTISTTIYGKDVDSDEYKPVVIYEPSYGLLTVDADGYRCRGVVCS